MTKEELKNGAIIALDTMEELKNFLEYLENETDILWITDAKPTDWDVEKFDEYRDFAMVVRTDEGEPCLQYCSLEFYLKRKEMFPYPATSYKSLFTSVRRF